MVKYLLAVCNLGTECVCVFIIILPLFGLGIHENDAN